MSKNKEGSFKFSPLIVMALVLILVAGAKNWLDAHPGFSVSDIFSKPTPVPTPLSPPTLPPIPEIPFPVVRAEGWEGVAVKTICLEVEENYSHSSMNTPFTPPIGEITSRILEGAGLRVLDKGEICDATLALVVEVKALSAQYWNLGTCFSGASVEGYLTLKAPEYPETTHPFGGREDPPGVVQGCRSPEDVIFDKLWEESYLDGLFSFWGPLIIVNASKSENTFISIIARQLVREALGINDYSSVSLPGIVNELRAEREMVIALMLRNDGFSFDDFRELDPKLTVPYLVKYLTQALKEIVVAEKISLAVGSSVLDIAFSPDGKTLVSADEDGSIKLWDTTTGKALRTLNGHSKGVFSVAFSPDGKTLVSGSDDETVRLWDATTGTVLQTLNEHTLWVNSVAFSPDGQTFASGSADRTVKLWDAVTGQVLHTFAGHTDWVRSVAFSHNGELLASSSCAMVDANDSARCLVGEIILWDIDKKQNLETFNNQTGWVLDITFSPDGKLLASGSSDYTITVWDVATRKPLNMLSGHDSWINSVSFSADGKILASGSEFPTLRLWDVATGQTLDIMDTHRKWVNSVVFSTDSQLLASGSADGVVKLWDIFIGQ